MNAFRKEIVMVLITKIILIYGIWWAFFSSPIDENLTQEGFANSVFGEIQKHVEKGEIQ